jgi:hypothetical protein
MPKMDEEENFSQGLHHEISISIGEDYMESQEIKAKSKTSDSHVS